MYLAVAITCLIIGSFIGWFFSKSKSAQTHAVLIEKIEHLQNTGSELAIQQKQLSNEKDDYLARFQTATGRTTECS